MGIHPPDAIRNIAVVGSKGVGKTSLLDALLFVAGANTRVGCVADGTSVLDTDPWERKHKTTIASKVVPIAWRDHTIHCIDTPGLADFAGEMIAAMHVADVVLFVVNVREGFTAQSRRIFRAIRHCGKPIAFFLTGVDGMEDAYAAVATACQAFGLRAVPLVTPLWIEKRCGGVIDLLHHRAYRTEEGRTTTTPLGVLPEPMVSARTEIMDDVAETEPGLMEKYLAGEELTEAELHHGLAKGIEEGTIAPLCCGSGTTLVGLQAFLDLVVDWFPAPTEVPPVAVTNCETHETEERRPDLAAPFTAQIFKSTSDPGIGDIFFFRVFAGQVSHGDDIYNASRRGVERMGHLFVLQGRERVEVATVSAGDIAAVAKLKNSGIGDTLCAKQRASACAPIPFPTTNMALSVQPASKVDQDKLGAALQKLMTLDPTFKMHVDHEFGETIVEGLGALHLEVMLERLRERFGIDVKVGTPHIPYRERLLRSVKVQGKYKKQSGGRGQYGDCWLEVSSLPIGAGWQFESKIFGGAIPAKYVPAIEKGVREAMTRGLLAGFPVVDCKITVVDGSYHDVDSSDMAFQIAGSMAFKKAEEEAGGQLIEPIMDVEITVPQQYVGDVAGDVSGRRGRMGRIETTEDAAVMHTQIPLAELHTYAATLRAMTAGTGAHVMHFAHYAVVPQPMAQKIIAERKKG